MDNYYKMIDLFFYPQKYTTGTFIAIVYLAGNIAK